ncbi:exodeoxyribonuclease V subunit gamma [Thalassotalea euphylliae]|uniref:exodeoxyribonuclease V subunit gamma n=1 Tax=Thalassotalea euphylliae TaxID=1655234 RepID=UPI003635F5C0
MIFLYPANKMEHLVALLNKVQQVSPLGLFDTEQVIVQNAGMQHWLNMSVANEQQVSMNTAFSLPAQYLWKLLREIASDEAVPEQTLYAREVLVWRIDELLATDRVCENTLFDKPTQYWQSASSVQEQAHKRYQLAVKLADLYEQYLIFRPEWIACWSSGQSAEHISALPENVQEHFVWQGLLWQSLQQRQSYDPEQLLKDAVSRLPEKRHLLPKRLTFFGINAMAPMWLHFLQALGEHIDIHFFHLNPCADYWGDIKTEKQAFQEINAWTDDAEDLTAMVGNPLLANWGQQGREFLALLQDISTLNVEVFEQLSLEEQANASLLQQVQMDILSLQDKRQTKQTVVDDSIMVTSAHSAFREVQGLHDWLLHQFNQDSSLTPKDVLVMCPEVESYAPYVNAVFTRGWQDINETIPPLPCSIADRTAQNSDPIVGAFIDLLSLPDSRFQVSTVIGLLRLEAVQGKFELCHEDVSTICQWLEAAAIHWGLDEAHKKDHLGTPHTSDVFTWKQGLSKLMRGFAYGDEAEVVQQQLYLPNIEGMQAVLLGKLMQFLEHLQLSSIALASEKTAKQWHQFLNEMTLSTFEQTDQDSVNVILQAIGLLSEYTHDAEYDRLLALPVVKEFLTGHFSTPDAGRQFMVGQVTFCSMLPMRSIPFKIIAVLGLNDGDYPRQREPLAFDLMAMTPAKLGDRSRRGDDRYLFLEALLSARDKLYLSYQGRSVQNNKTREPSIVLQELFDYLSEGYGWQIDSKAGGQIRQLPLQPFSLSNYKPPLASFDRHWLNLALQSQQAHQPFVMTTDTLQDDIHVTLDDLIRFLMHPSRWYARQALSLFFDEHNETPNDVETFSYDRLASYQLKQDMLAMNLSGHDVDTQMNLLLTQARLSGRFADSPLTDELFEKWQSDNDIFSDAIMSLGLSTAQEMPVNVNLVSACGTKVTVSATLPVADNRLVFYRSSTRKAKDVLTQYLSLLIGQLALPDCVANGAIGAYFDTKSQKVSAFSHKSSVNPAEHLQAIIDLFLQGQTQPLLLNATIADKIYTARKFDSQTQLENYWFDTNSFDALGFDAYIKFFWSECPNLDELKLQLAPIFEPMYTHMESVKL